MGKVFKNTSAYTILLACLVIVAHSVIPHDHHSGFSISDEKCHSSSHSGESSGKSGIPIHCNAFNDLINEKHTPIIKTSQELLSNQLHVLGLPTSETFKSMVAELIINNCKHQGLQSPLGNAEILKYSSLRAPPSLV